MPQFQNKQRRRERTRASPIIDDVLGNVTAAVKRRNSVIIVTIWVVNLHFFVASSRSFGCSSGRCVPYFTV